MVDGVVTGVSPNSSRGRKDGPLDGKAGNGVVTELCPESPDGCRDGQLDVREGDGTGVNMYTTLLVSLLVAPEEEVPVGTRAEDLDGDMVGLHVETFFVVVGRVVINTTERDGKMSSAVSITFGANVGVLSGDDPAFGTTIVKGAENQSNRPWTMLVALSWYQFGFVRTFAMWD